MILTLHWEARIIKMTEYKKKPKIWTGYMDGYLKKNLEKKFEKEDLHRYRKFQQMNIMNAWIQMMPQI